MQKLPGVNDVVETDIEGVMHIFYPVLVTVTGQPSEVTVNEQEHTDYEWVSDETFKKRMFDHEIQAFTKITTGLTPPSARQTLEKHNNSVSAPRDSQRLSSRSQAVVAKKH